MHIRHGHVAQVKEKGQGHEAGQERAKQNQVPEIAKGPRTWEMGLVNESWSHLQFDYNQLDDGQREEEDEGANQVEPEVSIWLGPVHGLPGRVAVPHGERFQLRGWPEEIKIETFTLGWQ